MIKSVFVLFLLPLVLFQYTIEAAPAQVIIISHAEKSLNGPSLSQRGRERAAAYVPYFLETKELLKAGLPSAIYAIKSSKESAPYAIDTILPLADALKLAVNDRFAREDYKNMVQSVMHDPNLDGKSVLICWDPQFIPEIAREFKALLTPCKWHSNVTDRVWLIAIAPSGKTTFTNIPQRLLFGDCGQ